MVVRGCAQTRNPSACHPGRVPSPPVLNAMCGIAGYLTHPELLPDRAVVRRMCDRLRHRGPDGEGYYCAPGVALGHRRLSIIDVEGGAQPMGNEDGSIQIVFNGEIYNFLELRDGLVKRGHRFAP